MASIANYSRNQGTTWRITIGITDGDNKAVMLADLNKTPLKFFAGIATKSGQNSVPILFKLRDVETVTEGRGSNAVAAEGVYKVYAYIPADETGSCSETDADGNVITSQTACEAIPGVWTPTATGTTAKMAIGDWTYEIRVADSTDPDDTAAATTIVEGTLTIVDSPLEETTDGYDFTFKSPTV